jgi:predicted regulator of Ras-like GTPase activity (Roadblock/LC7/MglB family)
MFQDRLKQIAQRLEGAEVVALVADDGIPIEAFTADGDVDIEAVAAELVTRIRAISGDHTDLAMGVVRQFSVVTDRYTVMMGALGSGQFLLLVLGRGVNFGRARFELRRAPIAFEADLS